MRIWLRLSGPDMPTYAPQDGSLLSPVDFVDFNATHNGNLPWLLFPSDQAEEAITSISFQEMAEATHRLAHLLFHNVNTLERHVVILLIHADAPLYIVAILGIMRAGFVESDMSQ